MPAAEPEALGYSRSTMNRILSLLILGTASLSGCASRSAEGLVVVGVARETLTGNPWRNGYATLYADSADGTVPLAEAQIAGCGFFTLRVPSPGRYRIRVAMIGLEAASRTADIEAEGQDTLEFRGSYARGATHGTPYDAVMRAGECPRAAYGAPARE